MVTQKPDTSSDEHPAGHPVRPYLDLWNLLLILVGVALVLILRPFWP
jgi:hypothetical protein